MDDNARPHQTLAVEELLESKDINRMDWPAYSPDLNPIEHVIVGLREAGLSYRAVAARVQRNSSTIMRVSKQWTDEGRTARKSVSGPRNVTSAHEDRSLVRMAQTDHTAFSRQLAAQWSTATRVSLCASSIRRRLL
ncbi:transposable element Tcb2 transposase [Trichonephila clavipes]|nr:transposable element Tcb2 transposase [Trichonephila clavipes]